MWRVHLSRLVNHHALGGKYEMVSTRCYKEDRHFWACLINWAFFLLRGEIDHCANMARLDAETTQKRAGAPSQETAPQ